MRVEVDPDRCQGHTLCAMTAPLIFRLREEDGHAEVDGPVPADQEELVRRAARGCPEGAIVVHEDDADAAARP